MHHKVTRIIGLAALAALALAACRSTAVPTTAPTESRVLAPATTVEAEKATADSHDAEGHEEGAGALLQIEAASLREGERLRVVATTNLVGDVVRRVAGEQVDLTVLIGPGSDPHAYVATPQDMIALNDAHIIFVNGLGLEESLLPTLENLDDQSPVVSVNVGVQTISHEHEDGHGEDDQEGTDGEGEHHHEGDDPHTWQDVGNVTIWAMNVAQALAERDPDNGAAYAQAAAEYRQELEQLDQEVRALLAVIPAEERKLVTEHDNMGYFARAYGFKVIGSVIPSFSTMATISAQEMVTLQRQIVGEGVAAIFVGSTVNPRLAEQVGHDVGVKVAPLFTDSLSAPGMGAANYVEMMRSNAKTIAEALTSP